MHTVFATHFGRPLPRWADEGACTTVEHESEKQKQHRLLYEFLTTGRGIAFNHMFAMTDYPPEVLPLYAQGYSLARYLIAQGGKRRFVAYVGDGMRWNNWTRATQVHYSFHSLSDLQVNWLEWVRRGCPAFAAPNEALLASASESRAAQPESPAAPPADEVQQGNPRAERLAVIPAAATLATPARTGWYSRVRDEAASQRARQAPSQPLAQSLHDSVGQALSRSGSPQVITRPQQPERAEQRVIQW
jgi:hypothetical protein